MRIPGFSYCDVVLPVPVDHLFTYRIAQHLYDAAQPGTRVLVPFGPREVMGIILLRHDSPPSGKVRDIIQLLDDEPALTSELIELAHWIAEYYSAPVGEVFKTMISLAGSTRTKKVVSLTTAGRIAAAHFTDNGNDDSTVHILNLLKKKSLPKDYLKRKFSDFDKIFQGLQHKRWIATNFVIERSNPLRARSGTLLVEHNADKTPPRKLTRGEQWLLDYLQENSGAHRVDLLVGKRKDVRRVAIKLAHIGLVNLWRDFGITPKATQKSSVSSLVRLHKDQQTALDVLSESLIQSRHKTFLLYGVTGSGKTEIYLRAIEKALDMGKSALLLVPEIALTPVMAAEFFARFGSRVAILHSAFSRLERLDQWKRLRKGEARVAVGTRSAVFAPLVDLGLVVVDEEHDSSYKQQETPRYNGRDVAIVRAQHAGATVVLGSATPSLESRYNAESGKYQLLQLPERINQRPLPEVAIVDMRLEFAETKHQKLFSRALDTALRSRLAAKEQTILLLNRRGFSNFIVCRSCGERIECRNCSVTLTYHRQDKKLRCHYCDYTEPVPNSCPQCNSEYIYFMGSGAEQVEDQLRYLLPDVRVARLDRDSARNRHRYESILRDFRDHKYDVLVGTQMVAKGHDIPNVTLVGIVTADVGLSMPDFRAAERTFQILTQAAGRAGRGKLKGQVLLQTINPDHYAIRFAATHDYDGFYKKELSFRRLLHYPPFAPMVVMIVRSKNRQEAMTLSSELGRHLHANIPKGVRLLGPATAPFMRLKADYRYQFILKGRNRKLISEIVGRARQFTNDEKWPVTALVVDVDPMSVM
tara:strand:- start:63592 stop:66030 length:2439 start_codon:yes stop_codon:yes gene_type:complete